jgi:hypothetical protein
MSEEQNTGSSSTLKTLIFVVIALLLCCCLMTLGGLSQSASFWLSFVHTSDKDDPWQDIQTAINEADDNDIIDFRVLVIPADQLYALEEFDSEESLDFLNTIHNTPYVFTIPKGRALTLKSDSRLWLHSLAFIFEGDNTITLDGMSFYNTDIQTVSPMYFMSGNNQLILKGSNSVNNMTFDLSDGFGACIKVPSGVSLEISGNGSLKASSVEGAAGIGGGIGEPAGDITISGGLLNVYAESHIPGVAGAAIGGGSGASAGNVTVRGGCVIATSNNGAAGIGGGYGGNGGSLQVTGGYVEAHAVDGAAAIGGGKGGSGSTVSLEGGVLVAFADIPASAIGCGSGGSGGTFLMSGGTLLAYALGNPIIPAINSQIVRLPEAYQWKASDSPSGLEISPNHYPAVAFTTSDNRSCLRISTEGTLAVGVDPLNTQIETFIYINQDFSFPESQQSLTLVITNYLDFKVEMGEDYSIQYLEDGVWVDVATSDEPTSEHLIEVEPRLSYTYLLYLNYETFDYPPGQYQLIKPIDLGTEARTLTIQFEIY